MENAKQSATIKPIELKKLLHYIKEEFQRCIQCGKCVGICPAAEVSDFNSRKIIQMVRLGEFEEVLNTDYLWSCVLCSGCYAVCPNEINFSTALMLLRVISFYYGYGWEMDTLGLPFVELYLNTGMTVPDAESPEIMEIFKANSGTGGTMEELRQRMGLTPKRKVSDKALQEIRHLSSMSGMTAKMELIKETGQSRRVIEEPCWVETCNEIFEMIGKMPGGK